MNDVAKEAAKEIVEQMNDHDKRHFTRDAWADGISLMAYAAPVEAILDEIEEELRANPELHPTPFRGQTVRDYFERHDDGRGCVAIEDWSGWEIESHDQGFAVCSPGTNAESLGCPDDSGEDLEDFLRRANSDS